MVFIDAPILVHSESFILSNRFMSSRETLIKKSCSVLLRHRQICKHYHFPTISIYQWTDMANSSVWVYSTLGPVGMFCLDISDDTYTSSLGMGVLGYIISEGNQTAYSHHEIKNLNNTLIVMSLSH